MKTRSEDTMERPTHRAIIDHRTGQAIGRPVPIHLEDSEIPATDVARALGNGSLVTVPDTVPFCVWMAAHHLHRILESLGKTISAGGDCDTNAAIVCGIVALSAGRESLPVEWLNEREPIVV